MKKHVFSFFTIKKSLSHKILTDKKVSLSIFVVCFADLISSDIIYKRDDTEDVVEELGRKREKDTDLDSKIILKRPRFSTTLNNNMIFVFSLCFLNSSNLNSSCISSQLLCVEVQDETKPFKRQVRG